MPLRRADVIWTRFETWLAVVVLGLEVSSLTLWVFLKGLSTPSTSGSAGGLVFRAAAGMMVLGIGTWWGLRRSPEATRVRATMVAMAVGALGAKAWADFGVSYTSNLLNWYQQACTLTLFGGLRGIGTRLTLLLTILGGSLATARGKHITIDLVQRFTSDRIRLPLVVLGWFGSAYICIVLAWGFFDHIAIENFGSKADASAGQKIARVGHELEEQFFIFRKQIELDLKATPHVVFSAQPYAEWFKGSDWNEWVQGAGFTERYGAEAVKGILVPPDDTRAPFVIVPGRGEPRGELINSANLVYPIGFLIIAVRFILRSLLALARHVSVDPDEEADFTDEIPEQGKA
ncbi:MAG: hypothetical protein FJ104_03620 [Deltaproteobacteria bacterium]|nr:hypothetical protein [Deltaproteobacteria bacterium]